MTEIFGASISLRDNVSGVLRQARESSSGFRGEVARARRELRELEQQRVREKEIRIKNTAAYRAIEGVKEKLKPLSEKVVRVVARTEEAREKIKKVTGVLGKIKDKTVSIAVRGAAAAGKALAKAALVGTAAAFTAVAAAGTAAVSSAMAFESQMQNVGTLLDGDVKGKLQSMGADLKKVSIDTGVATSDLTDGLYQVVSAFGESAESVKQLEIAAKAAKAGNATTTDSVNLLSAVTKGYGDTSAEAMGKAADLAFATVKLGQTSFPELASSIGQVVPLASTLKVSEEELFGAMATLTGVTGGTAEVTTQLKATMQSFLSPGTEMGKVLKKMGYESGAAALESEGLGSILQKLKEEVNGDEVAFANLFSSVEAKNAVLALTGAQADNFASKTAAMADAAGIAQQAFDTQTDSVQAMAGKIKNAGSVMLTSMGEKALPYITKALDKVLDHLPEIEAVFSSVMDGAGAAVMRVAGRASELWTQWQPVLSGIGAQFQNAVEQAAPFFTGMTAGFDGIMPHVQPVVASLAGAVSSLLPVIGPVFSGIAGVANEVFPVVSRIISEAGNKIQTVFGNISSKTGFLQKMFETEGPAISAVLDAAWSVAGPILDLAVEAIDLFASAVEWAFPYVQSILEGVWSVLEPIVSGIGKGIGVLAEGAGKIKDFLFGGGDGSTASGSVGHNATGTSYWRGGYTVVGETGPEIVDLPGGSKVYSNSASQGMLAGAGGYGGINIRIDKMEVRSEDDIDRIAQKIVEKIDETRQNM